MKKGIDNFFLIVFLLYLILGFSGAMAGYIFGLFVNKIVICTVYGFFAGVSVAMLFHYALLKINNKL